MKATHKELILGTVTVLSSLIFWLSVSVFLPNAEWQFSSIVWSAIIAAFFLMMFWGLSVLLIENVLVILGSWALASYLGVLWFRDPWFIGAASLLFIFGIIGYYRTRFTIQSTLGGGLLRPLRKSVPLMTTFLLVAFATSYYISKANATVEIGRLIPEKYFIQTLSYAEPIISEFDSSYQKDATVRDFIVSQLKNEIPNPTPEQEAFAVSETVKKIRADFNISIKAEDPYAKLLYASGIREVERRATTYRKYFPAAYAVGLFFTLRFLAVPLYWLSIGLIILLLRILHKFGIIEMRAIPATILAYSFS